MQYRETQISWLFISIMLAVVVLLYVAYAFQWGDNPMPMEGLVPLVLINLGIGLLFYKMTTRIDGNQIRISYGMGLVSISIDVHRLNRCEVMRTKWWWGIGIRFTPRGMLYNIHGLDAVAINYYNGKRDKTVMVGSSQPEKLKAAIDAHFAKRA
ncbi:MAG: hypothetical protein R2813_03905 [Flavobacteriales bacterium]